MLPVGAAIAAGNAAIVTALSTPAQAGGKIDTVIVETAADRRGLFGPSAATLMAANTSCRGLAVQVHWAVPAT